MDLTYNRRQFVFERFNKSFSNLQVINKKRLAEVYGPATQTLLREALYTYIFHYPLKPEIIEEEFTTSEKKKAKKTSFKFKISIELPIFKEKIELEETIDKKTLESR